MWGLRRVYFENGATPSAVPIDVLTLEPEEGPVVTVKTKG
jgi:hypothetical protein